MPKLHLRVNIDLKPRPPTAKATAPKCTAGQPCQQASAVPVATQPEPSSSMTAVYVVAAVFAVATLGSIAYKYRTLGTYYSFWARIMCIAISGACFGLAWKDYGTYKANSCANTSGSSDPADPCPCYTCCFVLCGVGLCHLLLNLPFLYASEALTKRLYASYGLSQQASAISAVSAGGAGALQFLGGSTVNKLAAASGSLAGALMMAGWMRGEDGLFGRMYDSVVEGIDAATKAAEALVDDGLKLLGIDSASRTKLTSETVYLHARVQRGPDWNKDDEDGGAATGGEVFGFHTLGGKIEGKGVSKGTGYAIVKWDKSETSPGNWGEYRIGADGKFDLISTDAADDAGLVGNMLGSALGLFGIDSGPTAPSESGFGDQLEVFLTSASSTQLMAVWLEVFDAELNPLGVANEETKGYYRGAVRYRELDRNKLALVIEFAKLPTEAVFLALSARPVPPARLRDFSDGSLTVQTSGKEIFTLTYDSESFKRSLLIQSRAQEGFIFWIFAKSKAKQEVVDKWFALPAKSAAFSPGRGSDSAEAVKQQIEKVAKLKDFASHEGLIDLHAAITNIKVLVGAEARATELIRNKIDSMAANLAKKLIAEGKPPQAAEIIAKKIVASKYSKAQAVRYQAVLKGRLITYLRKGKPRATAAALAKQDALHSIIFAGNRASLMQAARTDTEGRDRAVEEAKKEEIKAAEAGIFFSAKRLIGGLVSGNKKSKKKKGDQ